MFALIAVMFGRYKQGVSPIDTIVAVRYTKFDGKKQVPTTTNADKVIEKIAYMY
jgi:hypothetical protein